MNIGFPSIYTDKQNKKFTILFFSFFVNKDEKKKEKIDPRFTQGYWMQLPYGIVTTTTTAERTNEKGMLPSPCKWGDAAHEKNKTKLKQGWCVVSEKTGTLSPRLKVLPYGWKKTRRFFFLSFFFFFCLFDWKSPPFSFWSSDNTQKQNRKIPNYTHRHTQPCLFFFFLLFYSLLIPAPICLREPFGGHLLHGNAINPIPFHDET